MPNLFDPVSLGELHLPNRIIMAPLTRCRASEGRVPNNLMREYYVQRATAGLIFTEATAVSPMGVGYVDTPGIWNDAQTAGWQTLVDAVHDASGRIVCQLWHVGRLSHPDFLNGQSPEGASDIPAKGDIRLPGNSHAPYGTPRALTADDIHKLVLTYKHAAENAKRAGFDGVELHAANGYLPDQFLRSSTNNRTDEYGGSVENRARFLLEVVDALVDVYGSGRVGVHLSPRDMEHHDISDNNPAETFGYVARELGRRHLAFLFTRESVAGGERFSPMMKAEFNGPVIANEQFTFDEAQQILDDGNADAVAWGQQFIANPDLPKRMEQGGPFNKPNPSTFYAQGATGYTDYPALNTDKVLVSTH